jgi:predicted RNase H-like nuclease (RuvC/YqgF family)
MLVGLDPGTNTGVAIFENGKLTKLTTWTPIQLITLLPSLSVKSVIFEDSRLTSPVWSLICALCEEMKINAHGISPKHKGRKLDAETFNKLTGWQKKSNQHERDAAMCVFSHGGIKGLA